MSGILRIVTWRLAAAASFVLLLFCGDRAFAQSGYIQGGVALDARRFSGQEDDRVFDGNVPGLIVGGAGFLTPLISAGVELDLGAESTATRSVTITIAGRPDTVTTTYVTRRRTASALFGIHSTAAHAVRVAAYAGLAFSAFRQRIASDAPSIALTTPPPETIFTHLAASPIVGVDVAVALARNVAVVGVVRAQPLDFGSDLRGFSMRPAAAIRFSF
jgi:hypothetical protein